MTASSPPGEQTTRAAHNAAVRSIAELLGKVATFVLFVVAARELGEAGFGVFAFALSFGLLLATVPAGGFSTTMVQKASALPESLDRVLTQNLVITSVLALPVFALVGGVVVLVRPTAEGRLAVVLLLAAALVEVWCDALRAATAVRQRQAGSALALVVQRFSTTGLAVGVLWLGGGVVAFCGAYLLGTLVGLACLVVAVRRLGVGLERGSTRSDYRALVRDSVAIGVDSVVAMALFRLDAVLLGLLATDVAVGHYSAAYRFLETVLFLTWTVNAAFFPSVSADPQPWRVRRGITQGLAVIGPAYLPFAFLLLLRPDDLLGLLYPQEFVADGVPVLRLLAFAPLVFALGYFASYGLLARERRRQVLLASLAAAVVNIAANLALIPLFGATGAAAVTTASYALEAVILLWWVRGDVGLRVLRDVLQPLLLPLVACLPFVALLLTPLPVLLAAAAGGLLYLAVLLVAARRFAPESLAVLRGLAGR